MASQRGGDAARGKVFLRANGKYDITLVCVRSDEKERYTEAVTIKFCCGIIDDT